MNKSNINKSVESVFTRQQLPIREIDVKDIVKKLPVAIKLACNRLDQNTMDDVVFDFMAGKIETIGQLASRLDPMPMTGT